MESTVQLSQRSVEGPIILLSLGRASDEGELASSLPTTPTPIIYGSPTMPVDAGFGSVWLGERLECVLNVQIDSINYFKNVRIKVECQSQSGSQNMAVLLVEKTFETINNTSFNQYFNHDIRQTGPHLISATLSYSNSITNENKFVRKFFQFTVNSPLALRTKITELKERFDDEDLGEEMILLEAQIHNLTPNDLWLKSLKLETDPNSSRLQARCMALPSETDEEDQSVEQVDQDVEFKNHLLNSDCIFQFVFILTAAATKTSEFGRDQAIIPFNEKLSIGRLDIEWRISNNKTIPTSLRNSTSTSPTCRTQSEGRLQTGMLTQSSANDMDGISATVVTYPTTPSVYTPFDLLFILKNGTENDVNNVSLEFTFSNPNCTVLEESIVPYGPAEVSLGTLTALNTTRATMSLIALREGLLEATGFWICYEDSNGQSYRRPFPFDLFIEAQAAVAEGETAESEIQETTITEINPSSTLSLEY